METKLISKVSTIIKDVLQGNILQENILQGNVLLKSTINIK